MFCAPSEAKLPHEASGAWTPNPKNERNASVNITWGMVKVAYTITGPRVFGTRCRKIMRGTETPVARAANTNSWFFNDRTWPRTIRAIVNHETDPSAIKRRINWPRGVWLRNIESKTMTRITYGSE